MKIYEYKNDTFPINIALAVYDGKENKDTINDHANSVYTIEESDAKLNILDHNQDAVTYGCLRDKNDNYVVLIVYNTKNTLDLQHMMHESYHALDFIITYLQLDNWSDYKHSNEHLAYLQGWIGACHENFIKTITTKEETKKKSKKK